MVYAWAMIGLAGGNALVHSRKIPVLLKAAVHAKLAHTLLNECRRIMTEKNNWKSEYLKANFEAGMNMTSGLMNLGASYAPKVLVKLLELVGVNSDRIIGVNYLKLAATCKDTICFPLVCGALLGYFAAAEQYFALGEPDFNLVNVIHSHFVQVAPPNSMAILIGYAFQAQIAGQFDKSLKHYDEFIGCQNEVPMLQFLGVWQKIWIHM